MNIYAKMSAITMEIATVAKNLAVGEGKSSYKAVGEADVLAAVKPIEAKYGVYSYPCKRSVIESGEMVNKTTYNGQEKEIRKLYMRMETVYRFVNMEKPDEYIDIMTYGDGVDTQDKAPGKAMTYSDKYALLKAYKIQTGDDLDQNASEALRKVGIGQIKADALLKLITKAGQDVEKIKKYYGVSKLEDLTEKQHSEIVLRMAKQDGNNGKG